MLVKRRMNNHKADAACNLHSNQATKIHDMRNECSSTGGENQILKYKKRKLYNNSNYNNIVIVMVNVQ